MSGSKLAHFITLLLKRKFNMKKINVQTKTEFVQFRVPADIKQLARQTAHKHFGGNMSSMFRYALHKCDFEGKGLSSTRYEHQAIDEKNAQRLAQIHRLYSDILRQLSGIAANLNQLAHHANVAVISGQQAISTATLRQLNQLWEQLNSLRSSFAASWKHIKESSTHSSRNEL